MYCRLPAFPIGSEDERIPRRKIDLKCHLQNISPSSLARSRRRRRRRSCSCSPDPSFSLGCSPRDHPAVLLARDPLFCPPRRSRVSSPALLCWVNRARYSSALNSQRRASWQSKNIEPVSISLDPLYTSSFFSFLYSHVSPRSCVTSTPTHACSTPRTHCRLHSSLTPSSSQLFRHECALGMIQSMLT